MKVECQIKRDTIHDEHGRLIEGVVATCDRCGHRTECSGTTERSIRRALVLMRQECLKGEKNFYAAGGDEWLD